MSTHGIQRLQQVKAQDVADESVEAGDKVNRALEKHKKHTQESYKEALTEVEKNREAREASSLGQILGTIFGGPIIGTLIGSAIAGWANDGDEAAAREAKKQVGLEDMQAQKEAGLEQMTKKEALMFERELTTGASTGRPVAQKTSRGSPGRVHARTWPPSWGSPRPPSPVNACPTPPSSIICTRPNRTIAGDVFVTRTVMRASPFAAREYARCGSSGVRGIETSTVR